MLGLPQRKIGKGVKLYPYVKLGDCCEIREYSIIGCPPRDCLHGCGFDTIIGDDARLMSHVVIYEGTTIGNGFFAGDKANVREMCVIGNNVSVGTFTCIEHHVYIGDGVRIHSNVFVPELTVLMPRCWIGPGVIITNSRYPNTSTSKSERERVKVMQDAVIGAGAVILPGVTVWDSAIVGAGSVVTCDVEANAIVVGNPARFLKWRGE